MAMVVTDARSTAPGRKSVRSLLLAFAALSACTLATTLPARADFCLQLNGGPFSGDIGFFRFHGSIPTTPGKIFILRGRAAGLSPAFGTAVVAKDGSYVEMGATFFIDGVQGQFDLALAPPTSLRGSGSGNYGQYGTAKSFDVSVVNCTLEP